MSQTSRLCADFRCIHLIFTTAAVIAASAVANADLVTLSDGNSVVSIKTKSTDPGAAATGVSSWTVDGVEQLKRQWYWYRIGASGPEAPLDSLTQTSIAILPKIVDVTYAGSGFTVEVLYALSGGTPGSKTSDLARQFKVINTSLLPLDFHFFEYNDLDLAGSSGGDQVQFPFDNTVDQTDTASGMKLNHVVTSFGTRLRQAALFNTTLASLTDAGPTTLVNTPLNTIVGPGDVTFTYQYDALMAPGSFLGSTDTLVVPEPSSLTLACFLLAPLAMAVRRRL